MNRDSKECPGCGLVHPASAELCECGHPFTVKASLRGQRITGDPGGASGNSIGGLIVIPAMLLLMIGIWSSLSDDYLDRKPKPTSKPAPVEYSPSAATYACHEHIEKLIPTPTTARFTNRSTGQYVNFKGKFTIVGVVDFQDLSGATFRKKYSCLVQAQSPNGQYNVVNGNLVDWY